MVYNCYVIGTCRVGTKKLYCACSERYTGRRCETDLCTTESSSSPMCSNTSQCQGLTCRNGGACLVIAGAPVCRYSTRFKV
jgi:hypothetical protein